MWNSALKLDTLNNALNWVSKAISVMIQVFRLGTSLLIYIVYLPPVANILNHLVSTALYFLLNAAWNFSICYLIFGEPDAPLELNPTTHYGLLFSMNQITPKSRVRMIEDYKKTMKKIADTRETYRLHVYNPEKIVIKALSACSDDKERIDYITKNYAVDAQKGLTWMVLNVILCFWISCLKYSFRLDLLNLTIPHLAVSLLNTLMCGAMLGGWNTIKLTDSVLRIFFMMSYSHWLIFALDYFASFMVSRIEWWRGMEGSWRCGGIESFTQIWNTAFLTRCW